MQVAPKTLRALSPSAIRRISQMADWLWDDHEEHAVLIALLEAGCTTDEVKSITGHSTDEMVKHYGKKVNQRKLAKAAIAKLVEAVNGNKK